MKLKELLNLTEEIRKKNKISPAYICGGTPRDRVIHPSGKKDVADIDLTTGDQSVKNLSRELFIELGKKFNVTTKTMDDGHSSIYFGNMKLDFSSNFNVPNIDSILKKRGIKNPTDMQKEIYSRDFTCNALLMTLDLKLIIDPTNQGLKDINHKIIRTCLSPEITLTTNKNRVVRAIYLAAKLDFDLDSEMIKWISKNPTSIRIASDKTLAEKLNKAIQYNPNRTTYLLDQMNLWDHIPITTELYPYYMKRVTNK